MYVFYVLTDFLFFLSFGGLPISPGPAYFLFFFSYSFIVLLDTYQIPQEEISLLFFSVLSGRNDASFFPFFSHLRFPLLFIHTCPLPRPPLPSVIFSLSLFFFFFFFYYIYHCYLSRAPDYSMQLSIPYLIAIQTRTRSLLLFNKYVCSTSTYFAAILEERVQLVWYAYRTRARLRSSFS